MKLPDHQQWQRLSPLLDELLDLDEAEQRRRLDMLRRSGEPLVDELDALLHASRRAVATGFLDGDAQAPSVA